MKFQQSIILKKVGFCLVLLFIGLMSASITHAETYIPVTKWGSFGSGDGQFDSPSGVTVDSSGNVYVADMWNHRIQKFDSSGTFITKWGSAGSSDGQFWIPSDVAVDFSGNIYVADTGNERIQKFDSSGNFITKWGSQGSGDGQFSAPFGVAVDSSGNVYVDDTYNNRIQKFDSSGNFITKWGSYGSNDGQFDGPFGVVVDSSGNVYVDDMWNHRIQKFDSNGAFITEWGSYGSGDGQFDNPRRVAVDSSGNVYVADTGNSRVQKFDSRGTLITKWGSQGSGDGQFSYPYGVAIDSSGNVYVADSYYNHIQKFALGEKITPIITWNPSDIVYGTPLSNAQFNEAKNPTTGTSISGSFTYTLTDGTPIDIGTVLSAGMHTLHVDFTPTDTNYYNTASMDITINVLKATPEIFWSDPAEIVFGTPLSSNHLNAEARNPSDGTSVPGSFTYKADGNPIDVGTVLGAGMHTLHVDFTPTDIANCNTALMDVKINVYKATPEIIWSNPADIVYGTELSSTQLNAVASVPGTFTYTLDDGTPIDVGAVLDAGTQTLHAEFTPDDAVNYNTASMDVTINVLTPVQKIQQMTDTVQSLINSGLLTNKESYKLISNLNAAINDINDGNMKKVITDLETFIKAIDQDVKNGRLSLAQGNSLINEANSVINAIK